MDDGARPTSAVGFGQRSTAGAMSRQYDFAGDDAPRRVPLTQAVVELTYALARAHNGGLGPNWIWQLDVVC